jgi:hypothetical protein
MRLCMSAYEYVNIHIHVHTHTQAWRLDAPRTLARGNGCSLAARRGSQTAPLLVRMCVRECMCASVDTHEHYMNHQYLLTHTLTHTQTWWWFGPRTLCVAPSEDSWWREGPRVQRVCVCVCVYVCSTLCVPTIYRTPHSHTHALSHTTHTTHTHSLPTQA